MKGDFELTSYHFRFLLKFITLRKKFKEDDYIKPLPPLLGFFVSKHAIFPTMQVTLILHQQKANIFNFLEITQICIAHKSSLPYQLRVGCFGTKFQQGGTRKPVQTFLALFGKIKTTHSCHATQKGWSGPTVLIRCELGFRDWATRNGRHTGVPCLANQALFCIPEVK